MQNKRDPRQKGSPPLSVVSKNLPVPVRKTEDGVRAYDISPAVEKAQGVIASNSLPFAEDLYHAFQQAGALEPPYDFNALIEIFEASSALAQNIQSYAVNIDGFGYHLEPVIDPDADDADDKIAAVLRVEKARVQHWRATHTGEGKLDIDPTPEEIAQKKLELRAKMHLEKARIEAFFESCCLQQSFTTLRKRNRGELEAMGNSFWEIVRDGDGVIDSFVHIPAFSMRLLPLDMNPVEVPVQYKVSPLTLATKTVRRYFRRFVQILETRTVYFKQLGDPRVMSRKTGMYYPSLTELHEADPTDGPATEVHHFPINSFKSPYGIPRWIGAMLAVLGTSAAEEVNFLYFDNKTVPPMALLVSGAHLKPGAVERIESYIENSFKGRTNFHKILVLEADPGPMMNGHSANVRITLQPLTSAQQRDGLFLKYIEQNRDFIGQAFRLPRILRGDIRDFNRATGEAALRFAEQQVFQPEREEFDDFINKLIFVDMGFHTWKFASNSPIASDPQTLATIVQGLVISGIITIAEARELAKQILNTEVAKIDAQWTRQPLSLTLAQVGKEAAPAESSTPQGSAGVRGTSAPQGDRASDASESKEGIQPGMVTREHGNNPSMTPGMRKAWALLKSAGYQIPEDVKVALSAEPEPVNQDTPMPEATQGPSVDQEVVRIPLQLFVDCFEVEKGDLAVSDIPPAINPGPKTKPKTRRKPTE